MKKYFLSIVFAAVTFAAGAWSQKGHDVTAYIAEQSVVGGDVLDEAGPGVVAEDARGLDVAVHTHFLAARALLVLAHPARVLIGTVLASAGGHLAVAGHAQVVVVGAPVDNAVVLGHTPGV